jgi:hypothetical protein
MATKRRSSKAISQKLNKIEALKQSGLSLQEACRKMRVKPYNYYGWRASQKRVTEETREQPREPQTPIEQDAEDGDLMLVGCPHCFRKFGIAAQQ